MPLLIENLGPLTFWMDDNEVILFEAAAQPVAARRQADARARAYRGDGKASTGLISAEPVVWRRSLQATWRSE